jgi:ketosteroid isomerase-like protein
MTHTDIVRSFYTAFQNKDAEAMGKLYHHDATFEDPAFGQLQANDARQMWKMLVERGGENLVIRFHSIQQYNGYVRAKWEADYPFSSTRRFVQNRIVAQFRFKDDKIIEHIDMFSFWKWSAMALGFKGIILGWTPFLKNKVRSTALKGLHAYKEK